MKHSTVSAFIAICLLSCSWCPFSAEDFILVELGRSQMALAPGEQGGALEIVILYSINGIKGCQEEINTFSIYGTLESSSLSYHHFYETSFLQVFRLKAASDYQITVKDSRNLISLKDIMILDGIITRITLCYSGPVMRIIEPKYSQEQLSKEPIETLPLDRVPYPIERKSP